jgi:hypothetical protein
MKTYVKGRQSILGVVKKSKYQQILQNVGEKITLKFILNSFLMIYCIDPLTEGIRTSEHEKNCSARCVLSRP